MDENKLIVTGLYIYPIKSCAGISLTFSLVEPRGLAFDRRWMLIDENNTFISQRNHASLALIHVALTENALLLSKKGHESFGVLKISFPSQEMLNQSRLKVQIWDDQADAILYPAAINQALSDLLEIPVRLVYMPDDSLRPVDPQYSTGDDYTSFSDGYPVLLVGQASMDLLNEKTSIPIETRRFRPNIVFAGGYPHQEDDCKLFKIGDVILEGVKPCKRCNVPTIDPDTGLSGSEPTITLASYRLRDKGIYFGQNVLVKRPGTVAVANRIELL
jgi:uncharacterized protein